MKLEGREVGMGNRARVDRVSRLLRDLLEAQ